MSSDSPSDTVADRVSQLDRLSRQQDAAIGRLQDSLREVTDHALAVETELARMRRELEERGREAEYLRHLMKLQEEELQSIKGSKGWRALVASRRAFHRLKEAAGPTPAGRRPRS